MKNRRIKIAIVLVILAILGIVAICRNTHHWHVMYEGPDGVYERCNCGLERKAR